jgi:hypothetical protein
VPNTTIVGIIKQTESIAYVIEMALYKHLFGNFSWREIKRRGAPRRSALIDWTICRINCKGLMWLGQCLVAEIYERCDFITDGYYLSTSNNC